MAARVGVLALQGDFREHLATLAALGAEGIEVRTPDQLEAVDALVIPGGESTTIGKLAVRFEPSSDAATARARFGRDVQRRRSEIAFKSELSGLPEEDRKQLLDAIQAATDADAWALLRQHTKLDVSQAEQVWRRLVLALVRDAIAGGSRADSQHA